MIRYSKGLILFISILWVSLALQAAQNKPAAKMKSAECLACHNDSSMGKSYVKEESFKGSIHSVLECADCHKDVKGVPHDPAPSKPVCSSCHEDAQKAYDHGFHAKAVQNGDKKAAGCVDCHGSPHELTPGSDPNSKVSRANISKTCGTCHSKGTVMESSGHSAQPALSYEESVHGKAVAKGDLKAAVCTDCHGNHDILSSGNPKSSTFKFNVPQTCAKCHENIKAEFMQSIHGQGIARGNWLAPVCTDCHGIHSIKGPQDPTSSVSAQQLAKTTCGRCHEGVRLSQEFGIPGRRTTTYLSSYHGMASQGGSNIVANCASCHGVHNILPSSDPRSMINKANLVNTCGKCHPGANENFTKGKIHIDVPLSADIGSTAVRWIRRFYLGMIAVVIGGMLVHNFIIWRRKAIEKRKTQRRIVIRMNNNQRYQHLILLVSFITLVLTGFALKYPDSWFASVLGLSEKVRGILHRIAGAMLIIVSIYHGVYLASNRGGRKLVKDMLPVPKDAWDVLGMMKYYLGLSPNKPKLARFGYAEKAEYWALAWGTVVMAATGLALWFKVQVGHIGPRWWLDVATAIHFYEAILATLAIVVWHFYQVMFDPDVYPLNWAWYDGRMDIEHYQEEHELDEETVLEAVNVASAETEAREAAQHEEAKSEKE